MKRLTILFILTLWIALGFNSCQSGQQTTTSEKTQINLRLKWAFQAQFAGPIIAKEKGFYNDYNLDVEIRPAGPDIRSYQTVASGTDDIGIGIIPQVIAARGNGVPLVVISQIFQDSPNRFVLKSANRIDSLAQIKGKKVGLWMAGDEIEFTFMLKSIGLTPNDVVIVPQKFSVAPFLEDEYVLSQVMVYNELLQIQNAGYEGDKLQILSPKDYNAAILGDLMFTTEKFLKEKPEAVKNFIAATIKGWKYVIANPDEAIEIIMKLNPELDKAQQRQQLTEIIKLINTGHSSTHGLGYIDPTAYEMAKVILLNSLAPNSDEYNKINQVDISTVFNRTAWEAVPDSIKK